MIREAGRLPTASCGTSIMALPNKGGFNRGGFRGRFVPRKEPEHRINHFIRVPQVRLVGDNVTVGVYPTQEALKMAQEQQLDLVEISPQADPPVCKIIDYNKFLYDKKKKDKEMKAKAKTTEMKEIRFTPNTDDHDFDFKSKHAENFLKEGNKVKAYVQFKGRAIQFKDRGELLLLKFAERLAEFGSLESMPKLEGKRMLAIFTPKGAKKKA
jgi:translation initiation factor IF-3